MRIDLFKRYYISYRQKSKKIIDLVRGNFFFAVIEVEKFTKSKQHRMNRIEKFCRIAFVLVLIILPTANIFAQDKGSISGRLLDASNDEPLFFANIYIEGTTIGTVSDQDGEFRLDNLDPGPVTVVFNYIGYVDEKVDVTVVAGENTVIPEVKLGTSTIMGEEAVVTAQLRGQAAAINKQVKSNTIMNVVSKEKILELPDQNAAESIGRLAGVSVVRDGGEGSKVTLRGLSPRLNSITYNGDKIPSTDDQDRSVDLSMFSTDALAGIEFHKALTPDMDGDAIGGQINFIARKARSGFHGLARIQTGYNDLAREFGQNKASLSLENRLFQDKFGFIISGSYQNVNRNSQGYTGEWTDEIKRNEIFTVAKLNLTDIVEERKRYSANLTADYRLENGEIMFTSNFGQTDREEIRRRRRYRVDAGYQEHDLRDRESKALVMSNKLSGKHTFFNKFQFDWSGSYAFTSSDKPFIQRIRFREIGAYTANDEKTYEQIINAAKNNLSSTFLKDAYLDNLDVQDDNYSLQANLQMPYRITPDITGFVKVGGKYREKSRKTDVNRDWTGHFVGEEIIDNGAHDPSWVVNENEGWILMENFLGDYVAEDFMRHFDESYYLGPGEEPVNGPHINPELVDQFRNNYWNYYMEYPLVDIADYEAGENVSAGYAMSELKFFDKITFIGGVRYERTKNNYRSIFGSPQVDEDGNIINVSGLTDTVGSKVHEQWLPMFHLKYNFLSWADLRLAVTKTLSRPNFFSLVPWERINTGEFIMERGEPNLKQMTAWNYDAILSFYGNFGLFTLGGFYKELDNIDYTFESTIKYNNASYDFIRPVNAEKTSTIAGFEVDLQTNLKFLPSPLDGIVISANYTYIHSETYFPILMVEDSDVFPYEPIKIDTFRTGPIPGQVDNIFNVSLGYEKGGFSARISLIYQGESLSVSGETEIGDLARSVGKTPALDNIVGESTRMDLTVKQRITDKFSVYLNVNNLLNTPDQAFLAGSTNYLTTRNIIYGTTADLGLSYKF